MLYRMDQSVYDVKVTLRRQTRGKKARNTNKSNELLSRVRPVLSYALHLPFVSSVISRHIHSVANRTAPRGQRVKEAVAQFFFKENVTTMLLMKPKRCYAVFSVAIE